MSSVSSVVKSASPNSQLPPPVQYVKGIGPARALKLAAAGFPTPESLYFNLPVRYEDRRTDVRLEQMAPGVFVAVRARVAAVRVIRTRRRGLTIIEAQLSFNGGILGATFFNQPWLHRWFVWTRALRLWKIGTGSAAQCPVAQVPQSGN